MFAYYLTVFWDLKFSNFYWGIFIDTDFVIKVVLCTYVNGSSMYKIRSDGQIWTCKRPAFFLSKSIQIRCISHRKTDEAELMMYLKVELSSCSLFFSLILTSLFLTHRSKKSCTKRVREGWKKWIVAKTMNRKWQVNTK